MPRPASVRPGRLTCLAITLLVAACDPDGAIATPPSPEELAASGVAGEPGRLIYAARVGAHGNRAMSVRADGGDARPLLGPAQRATWVVNLTYSPSRDRVAYHGDGTLHVARLDGGGSVEVGHDSLNTDRPHWSPDGRWLVATQFWPAVGDRKGTVWLMAADGAVTRRLSVGTTDHARFTTDGLIAVQGDPGRGEGWEHVRLDGTLVRRVGAAEQIVLRKQADDTSPDGRLRAAVSPRRGIYLTDVATGDSTLVLARPGVSHRVRWSPDGRHLAALADCGPSGLAPGEVLVIAADGSGARTVARDVFCRGGFDW